MNPVKVSNSVFLAANFSFRTHPAIHQFFKILTHHQSISSFISLQLILNPNWPHWTITIIWGKYQPVDACTCHAHCCTKQTAGSLCGDSHVSPTSKKKQNQKISWSVAKTATGRFFKIGSCCLTYSWCSHVILEHANVRCPSVMHSAATHAEGSPPTSSFEHKLKML